MSPFIAELSSHDSNSRGKRFSHFQAFADCGVAVSLQVPTGRVPISRLRATRHWEMVVNGAVKDERSSLRLPGLQMLMFEFICSSEELENIGPVRKRGAQDTNVSTKKKDQSALDQLTWRLFTFNHNMLVRVQARTRLVRSRSTLGSV